MQIFNRLNATSNVFFSLLFFILLSGSLKAQDAIAWTSIETAVEKLETNTSQKLIFVDVYTEWCGWCKRMDVTTFKDSAIIAYMNTYFLPVKLDAEQKEDITIKGHTYKFVPNGRRGYHEIAAELLQRNMSYPSYAILDENLQLITIIQGYQKTSDLAGMLVYLKEKKYLTQTYDEFKANYKP